MAFWLIYKFGQISGMALICVVVGRFIGAPYAGNLGRDLLIYLKVWLICAITQFAFVNLGQAMHWRESLQGVAENLIPILVGSYLVRRLRQGLSA